MCDEGWGRYNLVMMERIDAPGETFIFFHTHTHTHSDNDIAVRTAIGDRQVLVGVVICLRAIIGED